MIENAAVQAERERLEQEWWDGALEGYEANPNELPSFWFTLPPGRMTARQRGYVFGHGLRMNERDEEDK
jgi:hypothetical protein